MTGLFRDTVQALRFYSRLPIPALPGESEPHAAPDFARIARAVPLAGAVIGAFGAAVVLAGAAAGLAPLLAAGLAVAALVLVTGAFHEDGLADSADGIGGGRTREHKLEIMKDSRIGTYGGAALALSLLLRAAALAALIERGALEAALALVAAAALSRTGALWIAFRLPPARADGAAFAAGRPGGGAIGQAFALALVLSAVLLVPESGGMAVLAAVAATAAATAIMSRLAMRTLGGQTGDVAGATQQVAEIAILVALAMVAPSGPRI